jgi:hypothetical protein
LKDGLSTDRVLKKFHITDVTEREYVQQLEITPQPVILGQAVKWSDATKQAYLISGIEEQLFNRPPSEKPQMGSIERASILVAPFLVYNQPPDSWEMSDAGN